MQRLYTVIITGKRDELAQYWRYSDGTRAPMTARDVSRIRRSERVQFAFAYYTPSDEQLDSRAQVAR